jgi:hypothetical protein
MRAPNKERRPRPIHPNRREPAVTRDRESPGPLEINHHRARQPILPSGEQEQAIALLHGVLNRIRVVRPSITACAEILYVTHAR